MPAMLIFGCCMRYSPYERKSDRMTLSQREKSGPYSATKGFTGATRAPAFLRMQNTVRRYVNSQVIAVQRRTVNESWTHPGVADSSMMENIYLCINRYLVIHRVGDKVIRLTWSDIRINHKKAISSRRLN